MLKVLVVRTFVLTVFVLRTILSPYPAHLENRPAIKTKKGSDTVTHDGLLEALSQQPEMLAEESEQELSFPTNTDAPSVGSEIMREIMSK